MNPALQSYRGSSSHSMKSFAPGLTFHAQVGADIFFQYKCTLTAISFYMPVLFSAKFLRTHCHYRQGRCRCHFRAVLAGPILWTISTSRRLLGAFPECLPSHTTAASHEARAAEVYGEADEPFSFRYRKKWTLKHFEHSSYYRKA